MTERTYFNSNSVSWINTFPWYAKEKAVILTSLSMGLEAKFPVQVLLLNLICERASAVSEIISSTGAAAFALDPLDFLFLVGIY